MPVFSFVIQIISTKKNNLLFPIDKTFSNIHRAKEKQPNNIIVLAFFGFKKPQFMYSLFRFQVFFMNTGELR